MAATASNRTSRAKSAQATQDVEEQVKQVTTDIVDYLTEYAKENPGYAALWCFGVGFVLGWKLKPW